MFKEIAAVSDVGFTRRSDRIWTCILVELYVAVTETEKMCAVGLMWVGSFGFCSLSFI
jgi:hypothetical protein